ncbi:MAG: hypothetical protein V7637_3716 [Mycobacteriales bacterium]|jgi:hypothetical protein
MTTTEHQAAAAASPATADLAALQQLPEQETAHEASDPGCATTGVTVVADDQGGGSATYPTPAPEHSEEC